MTLRKIYSIFRKKRGDAKIKGSQIIEKENPRERRKVKIVFVKIEVSKETGWQYYNAPDGNGQNKH